MISGKDDGGAAAAAAAAAAAPPPRPPSSSSNDNNGSSADGDKRRPPPPAASTSPPVWHGAVAGMVSGLASRVVTHPADTIKARMQVAGAVASSSSGSGSTGSGTAQTATAARGVLATARAIVASEGAAGLYRGFGAVLAGALPANAAYFGGYEAARAALPPAVATTFAGDAAAGAAAQLLAGAVYTPVDIVKERLQAQAVMRGAYAYSGPRAALRALLAEGRASNNSSSSSSSSSNSSGGSSTWQQRRRPRPAIAALFRGYWATNAVWLPWNMLYVAGYERARTAAAAAYGVAHPDQLPAPAVAACSAAAAAAAAIVTHPGDVVKTRLQVLSAADGGQGLTAARVARQLWATEGPRGFAAGLGARLLHIAPGCALSWALYEHIKARLGCGQQQQQR